MALQQPAILPSHPAPCSLQLRSVAHRAAQPRPAAPWLPSLPLALGALGALARRKAVAPRRAAGDAPAVAWHAARRREMLRRHPELQQLRGTDERTLPLLVLANALQLGLAIFAGQQLQQNSEVVTVLAVVLLAVGAGGTLSLWSFSILHDLIHGTCVKTDRKMRENLLFWLSFPTIFGYHLYLQRGHLSHHKNLGRASMGQLFDSNRIEFEDGDVLFVAHRQPLQGRPFEVTLPGGLGTFSPSISHNVMTRLWDQTSETEADTRAAKNAALYCFSMLFERCALAINDKVVALFGRNAFFLQKPAAFHESCATYARTAAVLHLFLWYFAGPGALLYLLLAEVAWQLPVHPACAMFVSNHGSGKRLDGNCAPSSSLYVGDAWGWFDWVCLFSNYHLEHHDFPDIPLLKLPELRRIAPEFYGHPEKVVGESPPASLAVATAAADWLETVHHSFADPEPYACSVVNGVDNEYAGEELVAA